MSEGNTRYVPAEELEAWVTAVKTLLDIEDEVEVAAILDLAKDFAHNVARPAAPLTTYALGLAVGRAGGNSAAEFTRLGEELRRLSFEQASE
ncbi:MAG: DUF6457 domain-containing protein [Solirubrobacterales bacterium]|nr:DUF6457 domain-containing protein [Solirubrobacterales bacterium]